MLRLGFAISRVLACGIPTVGNQRRIEARTPRWCGKNSNVQIRGRPSRSLRSSVAEGPVVVIVMIIVIVVVSEIVVIVVPEIIVVVPGVAVACIVIAGPPAILTTSGGGDRRSYSGVGIR